MYSVHSKWSKVIQYFCKKLNVDVSQGPQDLELSIIFKKRFILILKVHLQVTSRLIII